jgi:hypothetical protein
VVGNELEPDLLALVTAHSPGEILALLDEAVRSHLVVRREDVLVFTHLAGS